jgi:hypothetical protein
MANELNAILDPSLTVTAEVYDVTGTSQGATVSMTEVVASQYSGTFDVSGLSDGEFLVHFIASTTVIGEGKLYVRAGTEVSQYIFSTIFDVITGANA